MVDACDIRVVTTTGLVLSERLGCLSSRGAGRADMLRARVWQASHPDEKVSLVIHDSRTGRHLLTLQLQPRDDERAGRDWHIGNALRRRP